MLCDDKAHPGKVRIDGVAPLKEKGFDFTVITDAKEFTPDMLMDYPVVLLTKNDHSSNEDHSPWKTEAVQQAFVEYVENGGGLLAIHSGVCGGDATDKLDQLIGCRFTHHPRANPVTVQPLIPHPITEGVGMYCEVDEHYHLKITADDVKVLIAAYAPPQGTPDQYESSPNENNPGGILPCCLIRTQGKGRVCAYTPGHRLPVWLDPNFQRTLENAINWCAGK